MAIALGNRTCLSIGSKYSLEVRERRRVHWADACCTQNASCGEFAATLGCEIGSGGKCQVPVFNALPTPDQYLNNFCIFVMYPGRPTSFADHSPAD